MPQEIIHLVLRHPAYKLDDDTVTIGGTFNAKLDKAWYAKQLKLCAELGVDPYFWIAFSMEEYGGYRVGADIKIGYKDRFIAAAVGRCFVEANGAAGIKFGDAKVNRLGLDGPTQKRLIDNDLYFPDALQHGGLGYLNQDQRDRFSFVLLLYHQNRALSLSRRKTPPSILHGLQSIHGYGELPYLYREGNFGEGKLMKYKNGGLVASEFGGSGIKGKHHPIYGYTLACFINQLFADQRIRSITPSQAQTPVTNLVRSEVKPA